jgi:hypothetical protein
VETLALTLALAAQDAARQQALARGAALMLVVVGLGVAVFTGLIFYAYLRRRRDKVPLNAQKPSANLDAWATAADRVEYERRADQYEDDDDDADESTWYDEGPDDDDSIGPSSPPEKPPHNGPGPSSPDDDDSFAGDDIPGKRLDF